MLINTYVNIMWAIIGKETTRDIHFTPEVSRNAASCICSKGAF